MNIDGELIVSRECQSYSECASIISEALKNNKTIHVSISFSRGNVEMLISSEGVFAIECTIDNANHVSDDAVEKALEALNSVNRLKVEIRSVEATRFATLLVENSHAMIRSKQNRNLAKFLILTSDNITVEGVSQETVEKVKKLLTWSGVVQSAKITVGEKVEGIIEVVSSNKNSIVPDLIIIPAIAEIQRETGKPLGDLTVKSIIPPFWERKLLHFTFKEVKKVEKLVEALPSDEDKIKAITGTRTEKSEIKVVSTQDTVKDKNELLINKDKLLAQIEKQVEAMLSDIGIETLQEIKSLKEEDNKKRLEKLRPQVENRVKTAIEREIEKLKDVSLVFLKVRGTVQDEGSISLNIELKVRLEEKLGFFGVSVGGIEAKQVRKIVEETIKRELAEVEKDLRVKVSGVSLEVHIA